MSNTGNQYMSPTEAQEYNRSGFFEFHPSDHSSLNSALAAVLELRANAAKSSREAAEERLEVGSIMSALYFNQALLIRI